MHGLILWRKNSDPSQKLMTEYEAGLETIVLEIFALADMRLIVSIVTPNAHADKYVPKL